MKKVALNIKTTFGDKPLLVGLDKCLKDRMAYLGESAQAACTAVVINVLKALRTITKVAKKSHKVEIVQDATLVYSVKREGGIVKPCIRPVGKGHRPSLPDRFVTVNPRALKVSQYKVFKWRDVRDGKEVVRIIVAPTQADAKRWVQERVEKRTKRYRGLARYALGHLMHKAHDNTANPDANADGLVVAVGDRTTSVKTINNGKEFGMVVEDTLDYATDAMKGGSPQINIQMKRAMNKMTSVVNQRMKKLNKFFSLEPLPTMFPEVKTRKVKK